MSIQDDYATVRENLFIGRCPDNPDEVEAIKTQIGASAILSLQQDDCLRHFNINYALHEKRGRKLGLVMKRCPLIDHNIPDQQLKLPEAVNVLQELLEAKHRVYVHCTLGINRAPTVVLAYLTVIEKMDLISAQKCIKQVRPRADFSWGAINAYHAALGINGLR
ncbi:MAG: hypothetical protein QG599_3729 [Pseudomonadota bacterium]|nr:hypothetical protein [Pseudomonadota bacterium]